jgi:copper chaperone CopZ
MSKETQLTLPVLGMTCANCAVSVERNARKEAGGHRGSRQPCQ